MHSLRVVSWNAEAMFTSGVKTVRATPMDAVSVLTDLNADIVVIPEFGIGTMLTAEIHNAIRALSYTTIFMDYNDEAAAGMSLAILSKFPIEHSKTIELKGSRRGALFVSCHLPDGAILNVLGVHLDDRNEAQRMNQIQSVADFVNLHTQQPMLVMGDFNAMNRHTLFAKLARNFVVRRLIPLIPHRQLKSVAERVSEMAAGTTIEYFGARTRLYNTDEKLQPTISAKQAGLEWMPSWPLAKIDWIFADKAIRVRYFSIFKDVGSDHRPIVADIDII